MRIRPFQFIFSDLFHKIGRWDWLFQARLKYKTERKLQVVTAVSTLFGIESFDRTFLVAFHVDHTAVDINGDGFELALSQQLSEDLEVDFSQHVGCLVTEVSQKA